jgi:hypothetical protein
MRSAAASFNLTTMLIELRPDKKTAREKFNRRF